jgi:hypothetical protein
VHILLACDLLPRKLFPIQVNDNDANVTAPPQIFRTRLITPYVAILYFASCRAHLKCGADNHRKFSRAKCCVRVTSRWLVQLPSFCTTTKVTSLVHIVGASLLTQLLALLYPFSYTRVVVYCCAAFIESALLVQGCMIICGNGNVDVHQILPCSSSSERHVFICQTHEAGI